MHMEEPLFIRTREHAELLRALGDADSRGVLLLGAAGTGKTTLLRMVEQELEGQGRAVFFVRSVGLRDPGGLGERVVDAIRDSRFAYALHSERTIRSSAGAPLLGEAAELLRVAGGELPSPVLLLDGLDESPYPLRMEAAVEELSLRMGDWKFVVTSRTTGVARLGRSRQFRVIELGALDQEEARSLLEFYGRELSTKALGDVVRLAGGNPLLLRLLAEELQRSGSLDAAKDVSAPRMLERLVNRTIDTSPAPAKLAMVLEQLALAGGRDRIASLAAKSRLSEDEVRQLLDVGQARALTLQEPGGSVAVLHDLVRQLILSRRILEPRFRLTDLQFGSEEAERDGLLDESYVRRPSLNRILDQRRSIVVGDRGSGKSAIFRKLAAGAFDLGEAARVEVCPVADSTDLLHRIIDKDAGLDAEGLRAAWLVVVASVVASALPSSAPKEVRRTATDLGAAFGIPGEKRNLGLRLLRAAARPFAGTTLRFAVGPVNLEAQLPAGSGKTSGGTVDIEKFFRAADDVFSASQLRVVVMFDRIDETFKYDRARQESLVQGLLQAEARVSMLKSIGLVVFLRTDLFELYDIQEKTKLVSRTVTLEWSEEEWLQLLVNRVLANQQVQRLAESLHATDGSVDVRGALEALFPAQIEGQPVQRWLIDSVRNGNGDVSPRLAILLLHLTRDFSPRTEEAVATLPLFSPEAVRQAMTKLSDLSYSEVVNDFKVATSFVLNCRAGKLESFALSDVEDLFDHAEGTVSEQVRLLERLGFLERVVLEEDSETKSLFRVPKLYTRCWEHA